MPVYLYWGEDDFALGRAVKRLQDKILDPDWLQFNYHQISGDRSANIIEALNQVMTPVFGMGERLVWLENTTICQQCSKDLYEELERTIRVIPDTAHLLLTTNKKIDGRLNSTKLIKKYAIVQEFNLIPPWETQAIERQVAALAGELKVKLTQSGIELLAESVGNNTRQLWNELEKLAIYQNNNNIIADENAIAELVVSNTQNSVKLAEAILKGRSTVALTSVTELIARNEPPLKIVATLVGQFRTWAIVKLMQEAGIRDNKTIANAADVRNPNRIFHFTKDIQAINSARLLDALPMLLDLEYNLKRSADHLTILQTKIIQLCHLFEQK
jgi:DNA polymerase III subunit delta